MISVVMPTHNTPQEFLEAAIQSILVQTYPFFEFIIIDDCSTDGASEYLYSLNDERIRIITNEKNLGITKSLNIGFKEARGKYIARMDSDDISEPQRFEKQLAFMEANPDVVVCGAWIQAFGDANYTTKRVIPEREYHKCSFLFGNIYGLCHPTAFFRNSTLKEYGLLYNEELVTAQDYGMWSECVNVGRIANVEKVLLQYRVHNGQISIAKRELQENCVRKVQTSLLQALLSNIDEEIVGKHFALCKDNNISKNTIKWFKYLRKKNKKLGVYDVKAFHCICRDILKSKVRYSATNAKTCLSLFKAVIVAPLSMKGTACKAILGRIMHKGRIHNEGE